MRTTPPFFPALASGPIPLVALALLLSACTDSPDATGDPSQPLFAPVIGGTTQVVPSAGLPREYHDLRAALSARSNNNLDVVRHDGRVYLAWRTAPNHYASTQTELFVVSSTDERAWRFEARFTA